MLNVTETLQTTGQEGRDNTVCLTQTVQCSTCVTMTTRVALRSDMQISITRATKCIYLCVSTKISLKGQTYLGY